MPDGATGLRGSAQSPRSCYCCLKHGAGSHAAKPDCTGQTWSLKICSENRTNFRNESSWCGVIFDVARSREILSSLEAKTSQPDFWQDQEQAQKILQQRKVAEGIVASDEKL